MDKALLNILESDNKPVDDRQILEYLQGDLNADTRHLLEQQELDDEMMQDAMEGLQTLPDTSKLELIARELNQGLQKKLNAQQNKHRETRKWKDQSWLIYTTITIILLAIVCVLAMRFFYK